MPLSLANSAGTTKEETMTHTTTSVTLKGTNWGRSRRHNLPRAQRDIEQQFAMIWDQLASYGVKAGDADAARAVIRRLADDPEFMTHAYASRRSWGGPLPKAPVFTTGKGSKKTAATGERIKESIMYGAPAKEAAAWLERNPADPLAVRCACAGVELRNRCTFSTRGCRAACLYTSGHGTVPKTMKGRVARTIFSQVDSLSWFVIVYRQLRAKNRTATRTGVPHMVRMCGTEDLAYELHPITSMIFDDMQALRFDDYTKYPAQERPQADVGPTLVRSVWTDRDSVDVVVALILSGERISIVCDSFEPWASVPGAIDATTGDDWIDDPSNRVGVLEPLGDCVPADVYSSVEIVAALMAALA